MPIITKNLPQDFFWLACSSGIDSVACASYLKKKGANFGIFHFNHKYQPINNEMEQQAIKLACFLKVPYRGDSSNGIVPNGVSIEDALREKRIEAYSKLGANVITCHHLDDCVESYLMNCFKGVPEYAPLPLETKLNDEVSIIRPFLLNTKDDFIKQVKNKYNEVERFVVEDPTNAHNDMRRNWVRNDLIPILNEQKLGLRTVVKKKVIQLYNKHASI